MTEQYLLGVDVGTSCAKALLVSERGEMVASHAIKYALLAPDVGRSEQNAEDWWRAVVGCIRAVCASPEIAQNVRGIALSTQGGTVVPVDAGFNPLANAIVWNDARCAGDKAAFDEVLGEGYIYQMSGWQAGAGQPAMQLRRMRLENPNLFARARMFLTVPDFIAAKLTGTPAIDFSNAGINQLADVRARRYDPKMLDFVGVREDRLAELVPSCRPIGRLTPEAARELGLPECVLLVSGAHDQYAAALGVGICERGDTLIGTGTAWVITSLSEEPDFASGFSQSISASEDVWGAMLSISTGGVCLEWFRKRVAGLPDMPLDFPAIDGTIACGAAPGARGLRFYPYFGGASLPETDACSKATLLGLDLSHDRCDVAQAVMEGVACQIVWALGALEARQPVRRLIVSGGATRSAVWMQMLADLAGRPIEVSGVADTACAGAAMMAGVGCGLFRNTAEAARRIATKTRTITPGTNARAYQRIFDEYKRGARALREFYAREAKCHGAL